MAVHQPDRQIPPSEQLAQALSFIAGRQLSRTGQEAHVQQGRKLLLEQRLAG